MKCNIIYKRTTKTFFNFYIFKFLLASASINDACGKAYYFVRCIMTASIIDRKENSDEEKA